MKTFEETKAELLAKAKACGACKGQYNRTKKITTIRGLARVICDNWLYACRNKLITYELLNAIPKYDEPCIFRIRHLIRYMPEFIDVYDTKNLFDCEIVDILSHQPQLIEHFKAKLAEMSFSNIYKLLESQPQLISYFPNYTY